MGRRLECCSAVASASVPDDRRQLLFHILEFFRLEYAIYSENYLTEERIRQNKKEIEEKLIQPWKFEDSDRIDPFYLALRHACTANEALHEKPWTYQRTR